MTRKRLTKKEIEIVKDTIENACNFPPTRTVIDKMDDKLISIHFPDNTKVNDKEITSLRRQLSTKDILLFTSMLLYKGHPVLSFNLIKVKDDSTSIKNKANVV